MGKDLQEMKEKLECKMKEELALHHSYEAMMYVQTFVARKRKNLSHEEICKLSYFGIDVLLEHMEWGSAGVLLTWLISTGALELNPSNNNFDTISKTISDIPVDNAIVFLDKCYTQMCGYIQTINPQLKNRYMFQMCVLCGPIFEHSRRWRDAKNCYIGVGDISSVVRVTHLWSSDGLPSEYAVFFVRGYLFLLAGKLVPQAAAFYKAANDEYMDHYELSLSCDSETPLQKACMKSYQLWHLCTVINDLIGIGENPVLSLKVDRKKVFAVMMEKYKPLLSHYDHSFLRAMGDIGCNVFGIVDDTPAATSPMQSLLSNFMSGMAR